MNWVIYFSKTICVLKFTSKVDGTCLLVDGEHVVDIVFSSFTLISCVSYNFISIIW
ncbi:MAG: hypothetical protein ACKESC_00845 [Candidatus Hodgkinia cicadicola]